MELAALVEDLAQAFSEADSAHPVWVSQRSGRVYSPGIGPHAENAAVALVLDRLRARPPYPSMAMGQFLPYPDAPRQKCDLWIGDPLQWAVEVKMARFRGDNGKPDDTALKDILSPYESDRSAVGDAVKLARSGFPGRCAVAIYGFEYPDRPLEPAIAAFELIAGTLVDLGPRFTAAMGALVHPVHCEGVVFGWEVLSARGIIV